MIRTIARIPGRALDVVALLGLGFSFGWASPTGSCWWAF